MARVEEVDSEFLGGGVGPVRAFSGNEGVGSGGGDFFNFGGGSSGDKSDTATLCGAADGSVDGAFDGCLAAGAEFCERNIPIGNESDGASEAFQEGFGGGHAEESGENGVVAEFRVQIEG